MAEKTEPNPQAKAAKKSAASKPPADEKPVETTKPAPPPNILFGPTNADLNPAYREG